MPRHMSAVGGSAVGAGDNVVPSRAPHKDVSASEERIAAAALNELPARGTVLLDAGTVAECMARSLPKEYALTVVTNSVTVAISLTSREDVTVLLIGGRMQREAGVTVGGPGTAGLDGLRVDVAFMAADGVSAQRGLTTHAPSESATKRMMMRSADRVVLLAQGERIGHVSLARFGALSDVDCLVTESPCDSPAGRRVAVGVSRLVRA